MARGGTGPCVQFPEHCDPNGECSCPKGIFYGGDLIVLIVSSLCVNCINPPRCRRCSEDQCVFVTCQQHLG